MSDYLAVLARMNRIPGVRGSMVVAAEDGLIVAEDLMTGVPGAPVAALAASLFERTARSAGTADLGDVSWMQLDAEGGFLFVAAASPPGDLLLVVIAERGINVGLVRLESTRSVSELI